MVDRGEEWWRTDILMFQRFHRLPLDREGAHAFTHFYWAVMADQENGFRHRRPMLRKVLIPFIYKNRVWCLDETLWPIGMREFVGLNEQLATKFPPIHAGHQWQTIIRYYEGMRQELEALKY